VAVKRYCAHPGCGRKISRKDSYCEEHDTKPYRTRAERLEREPWARLYSTDQWKKAKITARVRDGQRCIAEVEGHRCGRADRVSVHHEIPVRVLWGQARGFDHFVRLATDPSRLRTLCFKHHAEAEAKIREQEKRGLSQIQDRLAPATRSALGLDG
jgi:hypothetical protein